MYIRFKCCQQTLFLAMHFLKLFLQYFLQFTAQTWPRSSIASYKHCRNFSRLRPKIEINYLFAKRWLSVSASCTAFEEICFAFELNKKVILGFFKLVSLCNEGLISFAVQDTAPKYFKAIWVSNFEIHTKLTVFFMINK